IMVRGSESHPNALAWSPDGRLLAATDDDPDAVIAIRIYNAATGRETLALRSPDPRGPINSVAWSPDGLRLATASDVAVRVWDAATGLEVRDWPGKEPDDLVSLHVPTRTCVAWSPDGSRLAAAYRSRTGASRKALVVIRDAVSGRETLRVEEGDRPDWTLGLAWSPDGSRLVLTGETGATVRDAATGAVRLSLPTRGGVVWSPDGRRLASADPVRTRSVAVWDAETGRQLLTFRGHREDVLAVAWSPDGGRIASSDVEEVKTWDAAADPEHLVMQGDESRTADVAWSPDGRLVAASGMAPSTGRARDGRHSRLRVWEAATGRLGRDLSEATFRGPGPAPRLQLLTADVPIGSTSWSPDGRLLAWTDPHEDATARVAEVDSGRLALTLRAYTVDHLPRHSLSLAHQVAWDPDGARLVSTDMDSLTVFWDRESGRSLGAAARGSAVAWNPDGTQFASGTRDGIIAVHGFVPGKGLLPLRGHAEGVESLAYDREGRRLASAGRDGVVKVWDAAGGGELLALRGHARPVTRVAWHPDGRRLASSSED
ncbi:MAG: WD40 repeat domain-containing protein, partial [Planctomycetia bacterium]|nr:WD40 repeat domain-containing protein [Planctomycetia bacterium]